MRKAINDFHMAYYMYLPTAVYEFAHCYNKGFPECFTVSIFRIKVIDKVPVS